MTPIATYISLTKPRLLPMVLFTGLISHGLLRATRPAWTWMPSF